MGINWKNPFKKKQGVKNESEIINDFYDIEPINNTNAVYRMIMGQRSNRKDI